jgi:quinol-cytochrome oxidoreductase complex cytochrome b subunit
MAENTAEQKKATIPFYPDHVTTEFYVTLGVMGLVFVVGLLGALFPIGLDDPADPLNTPAHAKPEWYFLFLYQVLKFVPKTLGVLAPIIGLLVVIIWPFIDRRPDTSPRTQRVRLVVSAVVMVVIVALTIWGRIS